MSIEDNRTEPKTQRGEHILPRCVPAGTEFRVGERLCVTKCDIHIAFNYDQDLTTARLMELEIPALGVGRDPNNAIRDLMANFADQIDFLSSEDGKRLTAQEQIRREILLRLFSLKPNLEIEKPSSVQDDDWNHVT